MIDSSRLTLRPAKQQDARMLWEWANDPIVRASAFSQDPIPWEDHVSWFNDKIDDPLCLIFIAENEKDIPVGQVRFNIGNDNQAVIDVHLAHTHRGKGIGTEIIKAGINELLASTDVHDIHSYVKINNQASRKTFLKIGFMDQGEDTMQGEQVYHYVFKRP